MTRDQAALVEKARASIGAARLLAEQAMSEFVVSHAYYAMFYLAQAMLIGEGLSFAKHSAVISAFGQRFSKPARVPRHFHRLLIEAQNARLLGDYGIASDITQEQAMKHIQRAEEFLAMATAFLCEAQGDEGESPSA